MRTRKSNKKKNFDFSDTYGLGSDDSASELEEAQDAEEDVEFEEPEDENEGQRASDEEAEAEVVGRVGGEELLGDVQGNKAAHGGHIASDSDGEDGSDTSEGPFPHRRQLPNRSAIHEVPRYPKELQQTRIYEGPLKKFTRGERLLNILYGPQPENLNIVRQMLQKWFRLQTLPQKSAGDGVMHSPWLAEDYEEKQKHWSSVWYGKYRAAKGGLQTFRKIRPDHAEIFKPSTTELVCLVGPANNQKQIRTQYGFGLPIADTGEPQETSDPASNSLTTPRAWLLDTGAIPVAIAWAPVVGHREQFLAACTVPYSDQDYKDADSPEEDPDAKKNGGVQIWSIPCHKEDGSHARLIHLFSFDWGRPKRLQWCPVPPPDDAQIGLLAILCGDGQVRVIEVPRTTSDQENLSMCNAGALSVSYQDATC